MNSYTSLIAELIEIGQAVKDPTRYSASGYLRRDSTPEGNRNTRAREIGEALNRIGGFEMMRRGEQAVQESLGPVAAAELSWAWHGVGEWLA